MHISVIITITKNAELLSTVLPLFAAMNHVEVLIGFLGKQSVQFDELRAIAENARFVDLTALNADDHATARNELAAIARAPVLFFFSPTDLIAQDISKWLLAHPIGSRFFLSDDAIFAPTHSLICRAVDFATVGGYDVNLANTGFEAVDLVEQFLELGREKALIPDDLAHARIERPDIPNSLPPFGRSLVEFYLAIKRDLRRLSKSPVAKDFLRSLMQDILNLGELAELRDQDDFKVTISPPPHSLGGGDHMIEKRIEYRFHRRATSRAGDSSAAMHDGISR